MVAKTRSVSSSPVKKTQKNNQAAPDALQSAPLKHFILPKYITDEARFVLLQHPRDLTRQRFLFCPEKGLFQFIKVSATSNDPRSVLFTTSTSESQTALQNDLPDDECSDRPLSTGYISKCADLFVATPFDLAFILIPLVIPAVSSSSKSLFQPLDDLLEQHTREDYHLRYILQKAPTLAEEAMLRICDTVEAGDEQMYRPSEEKTLRMIMAKVANAIQKGLPASLEEKFVTRPLEPPLMSVKREETIMTEKSELTEDNPDNASDSFDSRSSAESSAPSVVFSATSTTTSVSTVIPSFIPTALNDLQKQSTVLDFILASYVPKGIADRLRTRLCAKDSAVDFTPLEKHLESLAALRAEAMASRAIGDFSRKRGLDEEDAAEMRAEKKRKREEEEKKKKLGESRGVRDLKKVNVSGMKKMSDFFAKKPIKQAG